MKIAGIVLICLQIVAVIGGIANGSLEVMVSAGPAGIPKLLGFFFVGILGVILLVVGMKKAKNKQ